MQRNTLTSAAANYPYLQGLWVVPLGFMLIVTGTSNLQHRPDGPLLLGILGVGLLLALSAYVRIARYYRNNYGVVVPAKRSKVRHTIALVAWIAVLLVGANRFVFWSLDAPVCVYASAFALATLVYYAILMGLRPHHLVIWGGVFVAGLLPIWGGLGLDRDALAMFPLGLALIASGLLDQRLLVRSFGSSKSLHLENTNVGG